MMSFTHHTHGGRGGPPGAAPLDLNDAKGQARARARVARDALNQDQRQAMSQAITSHVQALLPHLPGRSDRYGRQTRGIGLYSTIGSEVDTRPLQLVLTRKCYPFALPTVLDAAEFGPGAMGFAMADAHTELTLGPLGIAEPQRGEVADHGCHHRLLALLVPCLAFSANGVRLGYGRGYYDRLLAQFAGHIIGLAYSSQQDDTLRAAPHDIALHGIITERGLTIPNKSPLTAVLAANPSS